MLGAGPAGRIWRGGASQARAGLPLPELWLLIPLCLWKSCSAHLGPLQRPQWGCPAPSYVCLPLTLMLETAFPGTSFYF